MSGCIHLDLMAGARVGPLAGPNTRRLSAVMAGLVPATHVFLAEALQARRGCPARAPGMTKRGEPALTKRRGPGHGEAGNQGMTKSEAGV
jgi:hypothetical protein